MKLPGTLLLLLLPLAALAAAPAEPAEPVERFHAALLDNMKQGQALTCSARVQRLEPVVATSFDVPFLAHFILRRRWTTMSEPQRQRFTTALGHMVVASYAGNFRSWAGEKFVTLETADQGPGQKLVRTRLERSDGEPVSFDYVLRENQGEWRIINVIADGVSDLALRSAQYEKLYAEQGFDALATWVENQGHNDKGGC